MSLRIISLRIVLLAGILFLNHHLSWAELNLTKLSDEDISHVQELMVKLEPLIKERDQKENLSTLTFAELYAPINKEDQAFLKQFETLDPKAVGVKIPFRQFATGEEELVIIKGQMIKDNKTGEMKELPPQFLPPNVYGAYLTMMEAMEKVLSKRLYIESGYRSSAYQLYLFVYYLKNHDYSINETAKFVALPGYSEHGAPKFQAIDFINVDGINGEDNPQEFEDLPEYKWLQGNAKNFGFVLSYPKDSPTDITYEPWHWRYEGE